jgi:hypothetical protein
VPTSYSQTSYHAEHAYRFTAAGGTSRFGRYRWVPEEGASYLSPDDATRRSANFLLEELESRLRNGPVAFRLLLQLAGDSYPTDDVTALWPADRPLVELGRLEVTCISESGKDDGVGAGCGRPRGIQGRPRPSRSGVRRAPKAGAKPERSREPRERELGLNCKVGRKLRP